MWKMKSDNFCQTEYRYLRGLCYAARRMDRKACKELVAVQIEVLRQVNQCQRWKSEQFDSDQALAENNSSITSLLHFRGGIRTED